jgi:hypothetical protein
MTAGATPQSTARLAVEFVPNPDDLLHARRIAFRRALLNPPAVMIFSGCLLLAAGGAMMAAIGSSVWLTLAMFGLIAFISLALAFARLAPTPTKIDKEFATRPWLRSPIRVEATAEALIYEHGPIRARLTWAAFSRLMETDHALLLEETPSPAAMFYSLPKRELDRTCGGTAAWCAFLSDRLRARARDR